MDFGTVIYLLLALGFLLYRKAKKDAEKAKPRPMNGQGEPRRKDEDFSLEEILRKIKEAQDQPQRPAAVPKVPAADDRLPFEKRRPLEKADDKLPFEKRKPLEKIVEKPARTRESSPKTVDYDERTIERMQQGKAAPKREHKPADFHFREKEEDAEIREWLDIRKAIIGAEILKRPEY